MHVARKAGRGPFPFRGKGLFVADDGGYTVISAAISLLVSLALVFSLVNVRWMLSRSGDLQTVADASALAGENVVGSYVTLARVTDASVLSLGLSGVVTIGAGLIVSLIPVLPGVGPNIIKAGQKFLDMRKHLADSAKRGLTHIENALPVLSAANATRTAIANSSETVPVVGSAFLYPRKSQTSWSAFDTNPDVSDAKTSAIKLKELSEERARVDEEKRKALHSGWYDDCRRTPHCLRERAKQLANLPSSQNPDYPSEENWNFGVALERARAYYAKRYAQEDSSYGSIEDRRDAECRKRFYAWALDQMRQSSYVENPDGTVRIDLRELFSDSDGLRKTRLYTEKTWFCTVKRKRSPEAYPEMTHWKLLHAISDCSGASGVAAEMHSLQDLERGEAEVCPSCEMNVAAMARVAAASTNIDNGFEHHWRNIVRASKNYEWAHNEYVRLEKETCKEAVRASDAFHKALKALEVPRPKLCPPGAWGCVAMAVRGNTETFNQYASTLAAGAHVPAGATISAAALAPDKATAENTILSRFFDGISAQMNGAPWLKDVPSSIGGLWGRLLLSYGSLVENVTKIADNLFNGIGKIFGDEIARWLRDRLLGLIRIAGLEPVDMRLAKPVLTNSQDVLARAGYKGSGEVRRIVQQASTWSAPKEKISEVLAKVRQQLGGSQITFAEIVVPGTNIKIPLQVSVDDLFKAAGAS